MLFFSVNNIMQIKDKDFVNFKINRLTVVERAFTRKRIVYWLCKCDCGNTRYYCKAQLLKGTLISCGCWKKESFWKNHKNWRGIGELSSSFYCNIKHTAKRRKIEFNISLQYMSELFDKQNKKCAISGLDLQMPKHSQDRTNGNKTASLDRINSDKGYIEGNLQWVHKDINMMKQKFNQEHFINMCHIISKFNNK